MITFLNEFTFTKVGIDILICIAALGYFLQLDGFEAGSRVQKAVRYGVNAGGVIVTVLFAVELVVYLLGLL